MWCGLFHDRVIGPFFFNEATIRQDNFLDMLLQFALPQVRDRQPQVIFQLDGAPPHWGLDVRAVLNTEFPGRWIGRGGPTPWPPRSPDVTPLDFFSGVSSKVKFSRHLLTTFSNSEDALKMLLVLSRTQCSPRHGEN